MLFQAHNYITVILAFSNN